jgi:hypothetical protein
MNNDLVWRRDGTPTLRMNEFVLASIASGRVDLKSYKNLRIEVV